MVEVIPCKSKKKKKIRTTVLKEGEGKKLLKKLKGSSERLWTLGELLWDPDDVVWPRRHKNAFFSTLPGISTDALGMSWVSILGMDIHVLCRALRSSVSGSAGCRFGGLESEETKNWEDAS